MGVKTGIVWSGLVALALAGCGGGEGGKVTGPTSTTIVNCEETSGTGGSQGNTTITVNTDCPRDSRNVVTPPGQVPQ